MTHEQVHATLIYLRHCHTARAAGYPVSYTTDPAWLVNQAINRRSAQFADDPSDARGSCRTVQGRYPRKAQGQTYGHLRLLARQINTPRLLVRCGALGEWRRRLLARLPARITA